jgi:hypothetical protein
MQDRIEPFGVEVAQIHVVASPGEPGQGHRPQRAVKALRYRMAVKIEHAHRFGLFGGSLWIGVAEALRSDSRRPARMAPCRIEK